MERKKKGISRTKDFRYPPILPIVYYEGAGTWTASMLKHLDVPENEVMGFTELTRLLLEANRLNDLAKAASDAEYRNDLYHEYGL